MCFHRHIARRLQLLLLSRTSASKFVRGCVLSCVYTVVLRRKRVGVEDNSRMFTTLHRAPRSLLAAVGVVMGGDLGKRALLLRGVHCLCSRLPVLLLGWPLFHLSLFLPRTSQPLLCCLTFPLFWQMMMLGSGADSTNVVAPRPTISPPLPLVCKTSPRFRWCMVAWRIGNSSSGGLGR